jgi:hypothetical protein
MYHEHYLAVEDINISSNHFTVTSLHSMFQQLSCALTMLLWIGHPPILPMNQIPLLKFEDGEDRRRGEAKEGGGGRLTMVKKLIHLMRNALALAKRGPIYKKLTQHTGLFSHI